MTLYQTMLHRISSTPLQKMYELVEELRGDDISTATKHTKIGLTRMRTKLSQISKLCKEARKELLEMRDDGKIRST